MPTHLIPPYTGPGVFIAMPYKKKFNKVYSVIQKAVRTAGAHPIRVDKTQELGNLLEQTHRYLKEANVVLAVITDNNPNVLNEIGYAQAFGKFILPVMQRCPADIPRRRKQRYKVPFNLRPIRLLRYGKDFVKFEEELVNMLREAIESEPPFVVNIAGKNIPGGHRPPKEWPRVEVEARGNPHQPEVNFVASLWNNSDRTLPPIFYAYLYSDPGCRLVPLSVRGGIYTGDIPDPIPVNNDENSFGLGQKYRLNIALQPLPPGAQEEFKTTVECRSDEPEIEERFLLRICTDTLTFNFPYVLRVLR
jgi:hypothetical protein